MKVGRLIAELSRLDSAHRLRQRFSADWETLRSEAGRLGRRDATSEEADLRELVDRASELDRDREQSDDPDRAN